jgi:hypothetical protein
VTKPTSIVNNARLFDCGNGEALDNVYMSEGTPNSLNLYEYNGSTGAHITGTNAVTAGQYQLLETNTYYSSPTTTTYLFTNGTQTASSTSLASGETIQTGNFIGIDYNKTGSLSFNGQIAEILFYNASLTTAQQQAVESYLMTKYGISTVPPPTISPAGNSVWSGSHTVTITNSGSSQGVIHYTTDGSTPTSSSPTYTVPFNVTSTTTVKSIVVEPVATSAVTTAYLQIDASTANVPTAGLQLWLKADNGASASSWADVSGNQNNFSQSNSSNQPVFTSNAINGLPAMTFSGSSEYMSGPSGFANLTAGASVFVVTSPTSVVNNARFFDFGNGETSDNIYLSESTTSNLNLYAYNGSTASSVSASSAITTGQFQLLEALDSYPTTAEAFLYNNAALKASGAIGTLNNIARTGTFVGCDYNKALFFNGKIAEVLIYNTPLSPAQKAAVEGYLFARYALTVGTPVILPGNCVAASQQSVTINGDPGATVHYTTDGSTPTTSSPVYTAPLNITTTTTVKAIAVQSFGTSAVASAYVQIDPLTAALPLTNMTLWLKADNSASPSLWADVSGNQNNFAQSNSSNQPTIVSNAVNGLPAVNFSGSSQYFTSSLAPFTNSQGSVFVVTKPASVVNNANFLAFNYENLSETTTNNWNLNTSSGAYTLTATNALSTSQYQVLEAINSSTDNTATIYTNGVFNSGYSSYPFILGSTPGLIGSNTAESIFFNGRIAEILIYGAVLTSSQRAAVENYLLARYGILVHPPVITPGSTVSPTSPVTVTMSATDPGAVIHYATDGSTPTSSSPVYSTPLNITSNTTIKAISVQPFGSSTVSTAAIQIDPSVANLPTTNLALWLKADNGAFPALWSDCSGNKHDFTQANSSNQPTIVSNVVHGLPAVNFSGSSQFLSGPDLGALNTGANVFIVTKPTAVTNNARFIDEGVAEANGNLYLSESTPLGLNFYCYSGTTASS